MLHNNLGTHTNDTIYHSFCFKIMFAFRINLPKTKRCEILTIILVYRVSQVSCNIKNRHISACRSSNQFLKKNLKRSWSALLACKISWHLDYLFGDHISLKFTSNFWPCLFLFLHFLLYLEVAVFNNLAFFNQSS